MKPDPGLLFWIVLYFSIVAVAVAAVAIYQLLKKQHQYDLFQKILITLSVFLIPLLGAISFLIYSYRHDKKFQLAKEGGASHNKFSEKQEDL